MEFADVECFSNTFKSNSCVYKPGKVSLHLDVSNQDHLALKKFLVAEKLSVQVDFPDQKSNEVIIRGDVNSVISMKSRLRKLAPLVVFINLPESFPKERVNVICNLIQDRTSIVVSPFWCGFAYSIYLFARSDQESTFNLVFGQVLSLLKSYDVTDPLCLSPMEIDPEHHLIVHKELLEHLKTFISPQDVKVKFPQNSAMKSTLYLHGNVKSVPKMKQKLYRSLPVILSFNFNHRNINKMDVRCIEEKYNVRIDFKSGTAEISTSEKYFKDLFEARQSMYDLRIRKWRK